VSFEFSLYEEQRVDSIVFGPVIGGKEQRPGFEGIIAGNFRHEKCASRWPAHFLIQGAYFFAGVVWVVLVPERTEWSAVERESRMVRPMELSMKMMAE